jgi:hypothetical protein
VFICLRSQIPSPPHPPPPPETHFMNSCTNSHEEGGRGYGWTSEKVRGALVHKSGRKCLYRYLTYSISSRQKWRHFEFGVSIDIWFMGNKVMDEARALFCCRLVWITPPLPLPHSWWLIQGYTQWHRATIQAPPPSVRADFLKALYVSFCAYCFLCKT